MTEPVQSCDKPLLLVDIDGVLSLFGFAPDRIPARGRWHQVDGAAHLLSQEAAEHLLDLAREFEPVWCSGWEDRANEHLPHVLRVGPFPHLEFEPGSPGHWKLAAIDAFAGPRRALAWIDDDLNAACADWARARPGPTLLVRTDPATGLTATVAERLRAWASDLRRLGVSSITDEGDVAT